MSVGHSTVRDFWYYGLRLRSDLPLTGLPQAPADCDAPVFLLQQDDVPLRLAAADLAGARFARDENGRVLVRFPGLFALLLIDEGQAVVHIDPAADVAEFEGYLLSYIAGLVLHRRRVLPLHASSVALPDGAVVIAGHSGEGKSTLAAALARAGHRLLSDDITAVHFDGAGRPLAVPGSPNLRLKADSADINGLDPNSLLHGRPGDDKKIWLRKAGGFDPVPVAAVVRLDLAPPGEGPRLHQLFGAGALMPLQQLIYRFALGRRLGAGGKLAHEALRLAAKVPIYRLSRSREFSALGETLHLLVDGTRNRP